MRVAIVNHNLGSGGAEKLIHDMAIEMKNQNFKVDVVLLTSCNGVYDKSLIQNGINVIYLSDKWEIYSPKNIFRLIKILKKYDVIHTHTYAAQLWTFFASLFLNKKKVLITTEHNTRNRRRDIKLFKYLDKWMYSRYNKIISITKSTELNLKNWLKSKNEKKYRIINNGINIEKYLKIQKIERKKIDNTLKENDILICMIARFSKQKDHITVIKSLDNLEKKYKLLLLGEGNNLQEKKIVEELKLEERVYFLGYRYDAPNILKTCDIAVLSSNWEGFGLAAVESMALGIPTIGSNVEGLKEILENGGLIFKKGDYKELAVLIKEYIKDKDKYNVISKLGIEKSKKYSIKHLVDEYLNVYTEEENY